MPTRRNFLTAILSAIASLPCMGWLKRAPATLQFTDGVATFHCNGFPGKWILDAFWRVNSKPWRGHAPGTVQLREHRWTRDKGSDFGFRKLESSEYALWWNASTNEYQTIPNDAIFTALQLAEAEV